MWLVHWWARGQSRACRPKIDHHRTCKVCGARSDEAKLLDCLQAGPELTQAQLDAYHRQLAQHQAQQASMDPTQHQEQVRLAICPNYVYLLQAQHVDAKMETSALRDYNPGVNE